MKMNMFKSIAITVAIGFLCLLGIASSSEAASITSLSAYANTDWGGKADLSASLTADEDIMYINWYVKQTFPKSEADSDYEYVHTSMHPAGTTSVSVSIPQLFDGHIKIATYDVKAEVYFQGDQATATDTVDVYRPVYEGSYKRTGAYGYSELTAHYFTGTSIVMDGLAWVYNGSSVDKGVAVTGRFRHTAMNKPLDELEMQLPGKVLKDGETASYTTSDWGSTYFHFNTTLWGEEEWRCDAYLRIEATSGGKKDDWFAGDLNTFDARDHR